jgi:hypothetical protein
MTLRIVAESSTTGSLVNSAPTSSPATFEYAASICPAAPGTAQSVAPSVVLNESAVAKLSDGSAPRRASAATGTVPAGTATKSIG